MHKDKERPKPTQFYKKGVTKSKINLTIRQLFQFSNKWNWRRDTFKDASWGKFQLEVWKKTEYWLNVQSRLNNWKQFAKVDK